MNQQTKYWLTMSIIGSCVATSHCQSAPTIGNVDKAALKIAQVVKTENKPTAATQTATAGTAKIWEDRGTLTPAQVFWGAASREQNPASRLPAPPFSNFEKDEDGTSPKNLPTHGQERREMDGKIRTRSSF